MNQPVEIVTLERGVRQASRTLSPQLEQRFGSYAASLAAGVSAAGFLAFAAMTWASGFVLHAPVFFATAAAGMGAAAGWAWRRTVRRIAHFRVGPHMEDDAFAAESLQMVRKRRGGGYELALAHGMTGVIEEDQVRRPIEGLTHRARLVWVPLLPGLVARIDIGQTTFIVRSLEGAEAYTALQSPPVRLALPSLAPKRFVSQALVVTFTALVLPFSTAVAAPQQLSHADMVSSIPAQSSAWQVEKLVYKAVQAQAHKLYACFEPFPSQCAMSGYVGVGVKLKKNGDVVKDWVSRSTYGASCPATACVKDVIAGLFFDELPEPMTLVIPVQVLENPLAVRGGTRVQVGGPSGLTVGHDARVTID